MPGGGTMTKSLLTTDATIRAAVKARLSQRHADDPDAFVVEELPVGRGDGRLDLAVINGRIEGVEIKSALDTLERLPRQVRLYSEGADRMTLVVAPNHADQALKLIPDWWTVLEARAGARGGISLRRMQQGRRNPIASAVGYLRLLEREELVSLLALHNFDKGYRTAAWPALAERAERLIPGPQIAEGVRRQLKIRVLIEARISRTTFGSLATGGGLNSSLLQEDEITDASPVG
jgi:hypothetical protein